MMNCSNKTSELIKALCAAAVVLFAAGSCTEVDDNLGGSLLPINQRMKIRIDNMQGVSTFTVKQDSLVSNRLGYVYFGAETSPVFGVRKNGFAVQFTQYSLPYEKGYGLRPIIDSLYLVMQVNSINGDTTQVQKFDVYSLDWNDSAVFPNYLQKDSTYYTFFDPEPIKKDKLFWFEHTGKRNVLTRLTPYDATGEEYLRSIVEFANEKPDDYKDDSLFLTKFKGLYVEPAPGSPLNAATYEASLESTMLFLYARNHDTVDVSAIYDTVAGVFTLYDQGSYRNTSINTVRFDYTGTPVEQALAQTEAGTSQDVTYVQTMGGVCTRLDFTDAIIDALRNLRMQTEDGEAVFYPGIMINQAEMYVRLDGDTGDYMMLNNSVPRLGSYTSINRYYPIPDYLYTSEKSAQAQNEDYVLPYDGYLNRSNGYYKLNITSYVQQLSKQVGEGEEPAIQSSFYMGPDAYSFYGFGETALKGIDSDQPVEIRITYTLIEDRDQ